MNSPDGSTPTPDLPSDELTKAEREKLERWETWAREQPGPVGAFILNVLKALVYLGYFAGCGVFLYLVVMQGISIVLQFSLVTIIACGVLLSLLPLYGVGKLVQWLSAKWRNPSQ